MRGILLLLLLSAVSCGRTEEPPSPQPRAAGDARVAVSRPSAENHTAHAPMPEAKRQTTRGCVVPMAPEPPPTAHPAERCPPDPVAAPPVLPLGRVAFPDAPGQPGVSVEIAERPSDRSRGLMYRTRMGEGSGMLFVWPDSQPRSFWMRNTCLPLDMLFIAPDDTIVGILEQVPTLNDTARANRCPANRVLEVNAGWARAHAVEPGQKIQLTRNTPPKGARP